MSDENTTVEAVEPVEVAPKKPRRRTGKIRPGETVKAKVLVSFVDGKVGEESTVEATDRLLDLAAKGYVRVTRVEG